MRSPRPAIRSDLPAGSSAALVGHDDGALDRGAAFVSAPAGGPFPALAIARELLPAFVAADRTPRSLATALEAALRAGESELSSYRRAARQRLAPYREAAQVQRLRDEVLPRLLDR